MCYEHQVGLEAAVAAISAYENGQVHAIPLAALARSTEDWQRGLLQLRDYLRNLIRGKPGSYLVADQFGDVHGKVFVAG